MNIKIILITTLFILMFCNTSMADTHTFDFTGTSLNNYIPHATHDNTAYSHYVHIKDIGISSDVKWISTTVPHAYWSGSSLNSDWYNVNLKISGNIIGSGYFGFNKGSTNYYIILFFNDDVDFSGYSGQQQIEISGIGDIIKVTQKVLHTDGVFTSHKGAIGGDSGTIFAHTSNTVIHEIYTEYQTENILTYDITDYYIDISLTRNSTNQGKLFLRNDVFKVILDETSYKSYPINNLKDNDVDDIPVYVKFTNSKGDYEEIYIFIEDEIVGTPTLNTDKTYYNISEIINISFTNINKIYNNCDSSICGKPYDLHILYPVTDAYKDYESKYIYPLTYLLEDETIYLNTSFLLPENNYILGIVGINGDYHKHEDILIFSDSFMVYPDNEYLSVSCDSESSCYTYNNADITIYYQINNNSDIIIKDNDNNIINIYHNIIGNGSFLYHIPDDLNHINTYSNWKVYLNNTEYSTSFNKGITVYWSQFQTPTPTPTYTPSPTPDINISDTIDEFKTETQPIKDLIFGLSEIVIDNPDYNKDNIVDESEINHWFNSLIPICIIFLLVVLYVGLKKKRE